MDLGRKPLLDRRPSGAKKTRRILNSPNRGGPDAALRPSTQILKQQISSVQSAQFVQGQTCKNLRSLGSDQKTPSFTEKEETSCVAPLCTQSLQYCYLHSNFLMGATTIPNLEQSYRKEERTYGTFNRPAQTNAGDANGV